MIRRQFASGLIIAAMMSVAAHATSTPATMTTPANNATFTSSSQTFTWGSATGATAYWLDVGTSVDHGDIFGQNVGLNLSQAVTSIPVTGQTIYVKLWSLIGGTWLYNYYTYTAFTGTLTPAVMTSPTPSSTLSGSAVTFTWNSAGASAYWLDVGTTVGHGDIFGQNVGIVTSQAVSGIPTAGITLYVKLWSLFNQTWTSNSYTYTEASASAATMSTPANNTTLAGSSVSFHWGSVTGATAYWLDVGTVQGQGNIYGQNVGTNTTQAVTGIPTGGQPIYVKLWTFVDGAWLWNTYTYTEASSTPAVMATPVNNSTLTGASATFTWNNAGATAYWLDVGTISGQGNLFGQNVGTNTSQLVTGIPTAGETVYVRLWSLISGTWLYNSYTYTAQTAAQNPAVISSPVQASTLTSSTVTFTWNNAGASAYWLDVGTIQGQGNIFGQNVGSVTTQSVSGIPTGGQTIYVKLWSYLNGSWLSNSYTYTAATAAIAVMQTPTPSSTLGGTSVTFTWNSITGATAYWLDVGTILGQGNIFGQNVSTNISQLVTGIPVGGGTLYVKLWTLINGVWLGNAYTYTEQGATIAAMTSPVGGTTFSGSSVTFTWGSATGATAYWLDVGTVVGQGDIFGQNVALATSQTVTVPTGGLPVYVRLWTQINGTWLYNSYTYTEH